MEPRILVAEDDEIMRITVQDHLLSHGWQVDTADNGQQALDKVNHQRYQLIVSDIRMPGLDGETLLNRVLQISPAVDVILMTAHGNTDHAVTCLKQGAADYILKPFDLDDLSCRIKRLLDIRAIKDRCTSLENCAGQRQPLLGASPAMQQVTGLVSQVAQSDTTVLIQGESGTGKEVVAAAIHFESRRKDAPYVRINCAAIPAGLLESELFGHEKGAFTGADKTTIGKFELADRGTILLDEIGDMPLDLQVKLLRVLQEKEFERVGGNKPIKIDVRVLCSTARDLTGEVEQGRFRQDLYYRLRVIPIQIPPLRERNGDIVQLADYFLDQFGRDRGLSFQLSDEARQALASYPFPGNVRELRNVLERVSVLAPSAKIQLWDLPVEFHSGQTAVKAASTTTALAEAVAYAEQTCIRQALTKTAGNKTEAAEILGISRKNLWEKMKLYEI